MTPLGAYPLILGAPWIRKHDARWDWSMAKVTFHVEGCWSQCLTNASCAVAGTTCSGRTPASQLNPPSERGPEQNPLEQTPPSRQNASRAVAGKIHSEEMSLS